MLRGRARLCCPAPEQGARGQFRGALASPPPGTKASHSRALRNHVPPCAVVRAARNLSHAQAPPLRRAADHRGTQSRTGRLGALDGLATPEGPGTCGAFFAHLCGRKPDLCLLQRRSSSTRTQPIRKLPYFRICSELVDLPIN